MRQSSMSSASEIGARIRELRIAQRMSQAELAEKSNISLPHISEIELGKSDMKLQNFIVSPVLSTVLFPLSSVFSD